MYPAAAPGGKKYAQMSKKRVFFPSYSAHFQTRGRGIVSLCLPVLFTVQNKRPIYLVDKLPPPGLRPPPSKLKENKKIT